MTVAFLTGRCLPLIRFVRLDRACHTHVHGLHDGCGYCRRYNLDEQLAQWRDRRTRAKPNRRRDGVIIVFGPRRMRIVWTTVSGPITVGGCDDIIQLLEALKDDLATA